MKNILCKLLCGAMTVSLAVTALPLNGRAVGEQKSASVQNIQGVGKQQSNELKKDSYVEGEVLVVSTKISGNRGNRGINALERKTQKLGAVIEDSCSIDMGRGKKELQISLIKSDKYNTEELMEKYRNSFGVQAVQPNYIYYAASIGSESYNRMLWGIDNQGQNAGTEALDINSDSEKMKMAAGEEAKEKVVAIIDTGVDYNNSKLSPYIWDNSFKAYLQGEHGYDFANMDADPMDDNGHGTHCAGIVSSVRNGENIKIMPFKFLDSDGYGETYGALQAYYYIYMAQRLGVNVVAVNNSWGGLAEETDMLLNTMINLVGENGAISICAAGNESSDMTQYFSSPASLDSPYIVSVAAANEKGELAEFSNYGTNVDVAAPGADILSAVSYNCFNPSIYEEKDGKKELCSTYEDFNGQLVTPDVPGKLNYSDAAEKSVRYALEENEYSGAVQEVVLTQNDYFGEKKQGEQALEWRITGAAEGESYRLYLPYEQEVSSTPVYLNFMMKMQAPISETSSGFFIQDASLDGNGMIQEDTEQTLEALDVEGKENYWTQISLKKNSAVKKKGKRVIELVLTVLVPGDYVLTIDDFAISKSNVKEEEFGKTAFYSGTSMATPYVAGAVAALANAYPKDSVKERIARVQGAVNKTEGLEGKVASEGLLDLSKADKPKPAFEQVVIQKNGQLEIQGSFLRGNAQVTINNQAAKVKSSTDKSIVIEGNYYNKELQIQVTIDDNTYSEKCFFTKGSIPKKIADFPYSISEGSMVCGGETMYVVTSQGEVYGFLEDAFLDPDMPDIMYYGGSLSEAKIFDSTTGIVELEGKPICLGSELYAVAVADTVFAREAALITFNKENTQWEKIADLPDDYMDINKQKSLYAYVKPILASYNGKIYLLGGFDKNKKAPVNSVYVYDIKNKKWNPGVSMPEGRFASEALQVGNKLVVTLGGNGTDKCPANLIFDGKNWTSSKAKLNIFEMESYVYGEENTEKALYATGDVGITGDGLIYTDCKADGMADIFYYQLAADKFAATGYRLGEISDNREIFASCLGEKLYIITSPENQSIEGDGALSRVYFASVKDGRCRVEESQPQDGGTIYGTGMYMPGSAVKITAEPWEDYYLKSLSFNGKAVSIKKKGTSTNIFNVTSNVDVHAEFGAYVTELSLDKNKINLGAGRKIKLDVQVFPENAEVKSLSYKSSNRKVVTVDSKGYVKANKNAVGKSAVITITAKDRKTVFAECKVKVVKAVNVKKITLSTNKNKKRVKAGKKLTINASISPKKADMKKLAWVTSNKKYATVKDGKVTAKKAGIGKIVTITAKATDGSKVKASIKIKIVK